MYQIIAPHGSLCQVMGLHGDTCCNKTATNRWTPLFTSNMMECDTCKVHFFEMHILNAKEILKDGSPELFGESEKVYNCSFNILRTLGIEQPIYLSCMKHTQPGHKFCATHHDFILAETLRFLKLIEKPALKS